MQRRQKLLLFSVAGEKHSCIGFSFRILVFDLIIMLLRSLTFNLPLFFSPFVISPSKLIQGTYGYLDGVHRLKGNQLWNDELLKARLLSSPHLLSPVFQACPICYYRLLKREQKQLKFHFARHFCFHTRSFTRLHFFLDINHYSFHFLPRQFYERGNSVPS